MNKEVIKTARAPEAIGPYSQAVKAGGFLYCSGQIPLNPATGLIVEGGVEVQARRVFENLKGVIESAGVTLEDVVKTTVFLKNMADFPVLNQVYAEYFTSSFPARSTIEVSALPKNALIEIEAVAVLG